MSDYNSSLPVRTETAGDVIAKIADALTPSQQLAISATGSAQVAGEGVAGTPAGGVLSVQGVSGGTAIPVSGTLSITDPAEGPVGSPPPSDAIYIAALVNSADPSYSDGNMQSLSLTLAGALRVDGSAVTQPISAASLPLPTGASTAANQSTIITDLGTINTSLGTINTTLGSPFQAGGNIGNTSFGASQVGTWTVQQGSAPWSQNLTQIGGASPSASNSLAVQISTGSAYVSSSNPLPVTIDPASAGAAVCDYKDASAIGAGSSDDHIYTVTAGKTLHLQQIESSAPGAAKMLLAIETGVATGVYTTKAVQFNSTASPNMSMKLASDIQVAAGVRVKVTMTNRDKAADDLYSSIIGFEI